MNIAKTLQQAARTFATRPAICKGALTVHDYAGLAARSAAIAAWLRARGIGAGTPVVIWMSNVPDYLPAIYGIWAAGCTAVPVNWKLHPREVDYIVGNCASPIIFTDRPDQLSGLSGVTDVAGAAFIEEISSLAGEAFEPASVRPEDAAWIFYTSGTTGRPKGAVLSHRNLWAMTTSFLADMCPVTERSTALAVAPLSHAAGLFALPFVLRGAANVIPESGGFDPEEVVSLLRAFGHVSFFAAPTMLNRLIASGHLDEAAISSLDLVFVGGAPIYVEDLRAALKVIDARLWIGYGQGEAPCTITYVPPHFLAGDPDAIPEELAGSVGIARTGVDVRVVDGDGIDCPAGTPGEVIVAGDVVMSGYLGNPEASAAALRDGWLWTGDIGVLDARGVLILKDRSKDVIISGGSNIYPREVEEVLLRYPGVKSANVVGLPSEKWGEEVVAFIVGEPELTADALDRFCLDNIARFKRPKIYRFVSELPTSSYGKILKTELRQMLEATGD
jgi:long-chain acyl-CoA synthetase